VSAHSTHDDDRLVDHLRRDIGDGLLAVYRFGSSALETTHAGSDIDIAILVRGFMSANDRFDVQERLAAALGRDVDLVDLGTASTVMAVQVIGHGRLLYEADATARGAFEDRALGAYARLNEERRPILERIAAEGTVHGR
jgi:uncharacterized protein